MSNKLSKISKENIVVVSIRHSNLDYYSELKKQYDNKFNFYLINHKDELSIEYITKLNPKYIFILHWSWIIPKSIYENYQCVLFHMTDLPFGRGGSPLQNLLVRGIYKTKISAIGVVEELDAGDIYLQYDVDISKGSAREIFKKLSKITYTQLIPYLLDNNIEPKKQSGKIVVFKRRTPEQSDIKLLQDINIQKLYDFIRMLDADGYPKAFLTLGNLKIEFDEAELKNKKITGKFKVIENE